MDMDNIRQKALVQTHDEGVEEEEREDLHMAGNVRPASPAFSYLLVRTQEDQWCS